jgi:hypothetical protein
VQYILSDGSILVQKENKKDPNKNSFRRMIVVNQQDLTQATIQVPQQRIITQPVSNGNVETKNIVTTVQTNSQPRTTTQAMTPIGPLTLTAEEYAELVQRRMEKQQAENDRANQEAQVRAVEMQQRAQQDAQRRAQVQHVQIQHQMQDHQNIAVQVQKIVQSLEEDIEGKKDDEMQLIAPKLEDDGMQHQTIDESQLQEHSTKSTEGKNAAGRPFACDQCGKKFLLKHHLTTHARVHTGKKKKIFLCFI